MRAVYCNACSRTPFELAFPLFVCYSWADSGPRLNPCWIPRRTWLRNIQVDFGLDSAQDEQNITKPGQDSAQRPTKHIDYQFSIYRSAYLKYRSKVSIHPLIYHSNLSASVSSRFIYLSICLSIYLSVYLSINLSIYQLYVYWLRICLSVYLSISLLSLPLSFVPYYNTYGLDSAQHTFKQNKLHGLDSAQHSFKQTPWAGFRPTFTHSKQTHSKQTPWAGFRPTFTHSKQTHSKQTPWAGFRPTFTHSKQTHCVIQSRILFLCILSYIPIYRFGRGPAVSRWITEAKTEAVQSPAQQQKNQTHPHTLVTSLVPFL